MHTIQWDGTGVSWSPRDDTYTLAVAAALHPPDLVAWLDQHLGAWLHERFAVGSFEVEVPPPVYEANRVPFTQIIIRGLREPFPDPTALQQSSWRRLRTASRRSKRTNGWRSSTRNRTDAHRPRDDSTVRSPA